MPAAPRSAKRDRVVLSMSMARQRRAIADTRRLISRGCTLCDRPAVALSYWMPDARCARRLNQPPGKVRVVCFAFCERHAADPDGSMAEAQEICMRETEAQSARPEAN